MTAGSAEPWVVTRRVGSPALLHGLDLPEPMHRSVWVMEPTSAAIATGSTQAADVVDPGRAGSAGLEVVRRRSGGGAVLLVPGEVCWIDVVLPRSDALWVDDVGHSFHWLGAVWARALDALGMAAEVHRGPARRGPWSELVCFAGLGAGEVTVAGRKVVGLSQRRTRSGARFQCLVHAAWDPVPLLDALALGADERQGVAAALADGAAGVGDHRLGPLVDAFLAAVEGGAAGES